MLKENIKKMRSEKGLTQKELADMLHVTAQAVSRWENGDVEPSVNTIKEMAKIFGVSTDKLLGDEIAATAEAEQNDENIEEKILEKVEKRLEQAAAPVLAVCEQCNKPIYEGKDIVRFTSGGRTRTNHVICKSCDEINKKKAYENAVRYSKQCRIRSYVWGGIISAVALSLWLILALSGEYGDTALVIGIIASVLAFPFSSCLFLKNNFVGDMVESICLFGFIKFPGLIFTLDLDGIIWLLTVKLLFWIIGFIVATFMTVLGVAVGLVVGLFVYPFALRKSFVSPEKTDAY